MATNLAATLTPTLVLGAISTATSRAARSTIPRLAGSSPVAPIRIGTPAAAQARACSATPLPTLKSTATEAPRIPCRESEVTSTPVGGPSAAASCPSRPLLAEATAPLRVRVCVSASALSSDCPMRPVMPNIAMPGIFARLVDGAGEELLDALEEGLLARLVAALLQSRLELAQQLLLFGAQAHRRLDDDPAEKIAGGAAAHGTHAFLAHAEHPSGLGFVRYLQYHLAVEG